MPVRQRPRCLLLEVKAGLFEALGILGERKRVLAVPPDFTRFHSKAGELTEYAWEYFGDATGGRVARARERTRR